MLILSKIATLSYTTAKSWYTVVMEQELICMQQGQFVRPKTHDGVTVSSHARSAVRKAGKGRVRCAGFGTAGQPCAWFRAETRAISSGRAQCDEASGAEPAELGGAAPAGGLVDIAEPGGACRGRMSGLLSAHTARAERTSGRWLRACIARLCRTESLED